MTNTEENFVNEIFPYAKQTSEKYNIPIESIVAAAKVETGNGKSIIGNNYFGIKGEGVKTTDAQTGQNISQRKYTSPQESFDDYGKFLTTNPRYREAFKHTDNPKEFSSAVAQAGYSEKPTEYEKALHQNIDAINKKSTKQSDGGVTISPNAQSLLIQSGTSPSNFLDKINADIRKGGEARDKAYSAFYELENKAKPPKEKIFEAYNVNANQTPMNQTENSFWQDMAASVKNGITKGWEHQKEAFTALEGKLGIYNQEEVRNKLNEIRRQTAADLVPLSPKAESDIYNANTGINFRALASSTASGISQMGFIVAPAALGSAMIAGTGGAATPLVAGLTASEIGASGIAGVEGVIDMFGEKYNEGRERGLTHEQAQSYAGVTMPIGAIMGIPTTGLLKQITKPWANKITSQALDYLIENGLTKEAFSETNKIISNGIADFMLERGKRYIKATAKESLLMGSTMGIMNALDNAATKYYAANSKTQDKFSDIINKTTEQEVKDIFINAGMGVAMSAIMSSPELMRSGRFETVYGLVDKNANDEGRINNLKQFIAKTAEVNGYKPETTAELLAKVDDMRNVASKYGKYVPSAEGRFQVYKLLQEQHLADGQSLQLGEHLKQVTEDLKDNKPMLEQKTAEVEDVQKLLAEKKSVIESFMAEIGSTKKPLDVEQQKNYQTQITELNGDIAEATNKIYPDAISLEKPAEGVLRQEEPQVELQKVEQGNEEQKPTGEISGEETKVEPPKTLNDLLDVAGVSYMGDKGVFHLDENGLLNFSPEEGGKPVVFDKEITQQILNEPLDNVMSVVEGYDKELYAQKKNIETEKKSREIPLESLNNKQVTYKGKKGTLSVDEGGKVSFESDGVIHDISTEQSNRNALDYGITPIKEKVVEPKHIVTDISETNATVDGVKYTIHTDEKGNISGISPENKPEQIIRNEKLLSAVESERNKLPYDATSKLEGEELNKADSETKSILPPTEQEADTALQGVYLQHMNHPTSIALDKVMNGEQITPAESGLISVWAAKVEDGIRTLQFDEKYGQSEVVKSALVQLDYLTKTAKENVKDKNATGTIQRNGTEATNIESAKDETSTRLTEENRRNDEGLIKTETATGETTQAETTSTEVKQGEASKGTGKVEEVSKVTAKELTPAIEVNGKVYEGANHGEAMDKAREAGEKVPDWRTPKGDKWRTENGKFKEQSTGEILNREQADKKYGVSRTEELGKDYKVTTEPIKMPDGEDGVKVIIEKPNGEKVDIGNMYPEDVEKETAKKIRGFKLSETKPIEPKAEEVTPEIDKESLVGTNVKFEHGGGERTGEVKSIDKDGNLKIVSKDGTKYTIKPEQRLQKSSSTTGNRISEKASKIIDKVLKKAFAGIKTTFLSGEEFKSKHGTDALGVTNPDGTIDLNRDKITDQTQVHEFGHIWNSWSKRFAPELYKKGLELAKGETELIKRIQEKYPELKGDALLDEVLATAIGEKGAPLTVELKTGLKEWVSSLWNKLKSFVKNRLGIKDGRFNNMENMTFHEFTGKIAKELLSGKEISPLSGEEISSLDESGVSRFMKDDRIRRGLESREATLTLEGGKILGAAYNFVKDVGDVVGFTRGEDVIYTHPTTGKEEKRANIIYDTKDITDKHVTELRGIFGKKLNSAIDKLDLNRDGSANNMVSGRNLVDARKFILENPERFDKAIKAVADEVVNPKNGEKFDFTNLPQDARKILSTLGAALTQADHMETTKDGIFVRPNEIIANKQEYAKGAQDEAEAKKKRYEEIASKSPIHKVLVEGWGMFNNLTSGIRDWAVGISGKTTGKWAETARSIQRAASNEIRMQTTLGDILKPFIRDEKYKNGSIAVSGGVLNPRMILAKPLDKVNGASAREIFKDNFMPDNYKITDMEQINIIAQIDGRPDLKSAAWGSKKIKGEAEGTPENVIQQKEKTLPIYIQESGNREGMVLHISEENFNALKERWKDDLPKWKEMWKNLFDTEYSEVNPIHQSQTGLNLLRIQNPEEVTFKVDGKEMKGILKSEGEFGNIVKGEDGKTYDLKEEEILSRKKNEDVYYHPTAHGKGKDAIKSFERLDNHIGDMSSFKERAPDADNPILIMDEFQMLQSRINNSSKYASWALPMHNGEVMTNIYGKDVLSKQQKEHWNEFKVGLINPPENNVGKIEKIFYKGFVQYALGVNPFTALKHISTLVLANNVVPQKYILSSLSEFPKAGVDIVKNFDILSGDEKSWNPIMQRMLKSNFGLLRVTGNAAEIQSLIDGDGRVRIKTKNGEVDFSGKDTLTMMKAVETATDAVVWGAVEKYVAAEFPHLKEGTQEHFDKVEQLFMDAINDSQPSFDYANRSLLSTRSGVLNRAFTVFSGQLTAQWNAFSRRTTVSLIDPSPKNNLLTARAFANIFVANAAIVGSIDVLRQQALGKKKKDDDVAQDLMHDIMREQAAGIPFVGRIIQEALDKSDRSWSTDINAPILDPIHNLTQALADIINKHPDKALNEMKEFGERAIGFPSIIDKTVTKAIK